MIGELVMTEHHCMGREVCSDTIGWAAYTMDSHNCDRLVVDGFVKNEGNVEKGGFPPYPISYSAIVPQKEEVNNLIVPVCLSASHIAYGSIRMEPVFMVLAQAGATAACMSIDSQVTVQKIDRARLQGLLRSNPLGNNSLPEILVDNDNVKAVSLQGDWQTNKDTYRSYGPAADFLLDKSKGNTPKAVRYTPDIQTAGQYNVYLYYPILEEGSTQTTIRISDGSNVIEKIIRKSEIVVEGQTSGEWAFVGTYKLSAGKNAYVEVSNKDADNFVAADAVLFIPVR